MKKTAQELIDEEVSGEELEEGTYRGKITGERVSADDVRKIIKLGYNNNLSAVKAALERYWDGSRPIAVKIVVSVDGTEYEISTSTG